MAQTGYTPILIYSSSTGGNAPTAGNLTNSTLGSELAINITDGKLFYKDNANAIQVIGWKTVPATAGGTGQTNYTTGDLLYASSSAALSKLADVATGNALISGGVGVAPSWGKIGLTTHVSGTLPTGNGGTGLSSLTAGDMLYYASGTALSQLAIGAANTVMTSSGSAPQWTAQSSLSVGTANNLKSNATTGVMQIVGPAAASTRVMTIPDANFTAARTDAGQTFTGTQAFAGITATNVTSSASTVINAGATTGASSTFNSGTGTISLTGANSRGIGSLFNANRNVNTTVPYGGSYEVFGLLSVSNMGAGSGYTTYGLAGYAESDGSPIGVRADAKSTQASSPAYGVYVGSVTGATNNYGIYVADTAAVNYFGGNIQIGTAAKGINFTANSAAAGMTSQLLNWYEEGTWTPADASGASLSFTSASGYYTRKGREVTVVFTLVYPATANANAARIGGLPFTSANTSNGFNVGTFNTNNSGQNIQPSIVANATNFAALLVATGTSATNVQLTGATLRGGMTYFV